MALQWTRAPSTTCTPCCISEHKPCTELQQTSGERRVWEHDLKGKSSPTSQKSGIMAWNFVHCFTAVLKNCPVKMPWSYAVWQRKQIKRWINNKTPSASIWTQCVFKDCCMLGYDGASCVEPFFHNSNLHWVYSTVWQFYSLPFAMPQIWQCNRLKSWELGSCCMCDVVADTSTWCPQRQKAHYWMSPGVAQHWQSSTLHSQLPEPAGYKLSQWCLVMPLDFMRQATCHLLSF